MAIGELEVALQAWVRSSQRVVLAGNRKAATPLEHLSPGVEKINTRIEVGIIGRNKKSLYGTPLVLWGACLITAKDLVSLIGAENDESTAEKIGIRCNHGSGPARLITSTSSPGARRR